MFRGTVAAGDGIVFQMAKPPKEEVNEDVNSYFTRKGFFAYGCQAFVSAKTKFLSVASKLCASAHDSTAYSVTSLSYAIREGKLPTQFHIVLDDAYVSTEQELTPWKGRQLPQDKDTFYYNLSLQRQVVERAFGLLVQRWGVFWRALRVQVKRIPLIISVACKLHNICVDRFGLEEVRPYAGFQLWDRDAYGGDDQTLSFTSETGMRRGYRSDLARCSKRDRITAALRSMGAARPVHSVQSRLRRV
jgi:hypothetical protein